MLLKGGKIILLVYFLFAREFLKRVYFDWLPNRIQYVFLCARTSRDIFKILSFF